MQLNDTLGNPVPVKYLSIMCLKWDRCKLKYRMDGCEYFKEVEKIETI